MNVTHTALPWHRDKYGHVMDAEGRDVMFRGVATAAAGSKVKEAEANTDLVVKAVNAHNKLIEALSLVMTWIDNWDPDFIHDPEWATDREKIDAALAAAGEPV